MANPNEVLEQVEAESGETTFTNIQGVNVGRLVDLDSLGHSLLWDEQNITDQVVAGAPCAGHIALHNPISPGRVTFYDSRGTTLHVLQLPDTERICYMCWNNALQHCIILTDAGSVYFRHSTGQRQAAADIKLPAMPFAWAPTDHGLCVVIGNEGMYQLALLTCVQQLEDYSLKIFSPARGMPRIPSAMVVIPSNLAQSNCDETYMVVNTEDGGTPTSIERVVWRSSRASAAQYQTFAVPFEVSDAIACMSVAPDGRSIAILLADGNVLCARPDFRECKVVGAALDISGLNYQFEWFGNECIALINHSEEDCLGTLFSVRFARGSDGGDAKSVDVELPLGSWAIVEPDGLRLISGMPPAASPAAAASGGEFDYAAAASAVAASGCRHRFWQVIPTEVISFYQRLTSRSASACTQLRVAYNAFRRGDAQCATIIKSLSAPGSSERLVQAISDTLQVACYEWDPDRQRNVLRVASYGKVFCPVFDSQKFFDVCRRARVAHALRDKARMIASLHQLRLLDGEPLIQRLINVGELSLACDVASLLGLRNDMILEKWAEITVAKARERGTSVNELRTFIEGLMRRGTFNLEPAVNAAVDSSLPRETLAEIIKLEKRTDKQMHYYLANCGKYPEFAEQAIMGAAHSGDSDVLFDCLMRVPLSRDLLARMPEISHNLDATAAMLVRFSPSAVDSDPRLSALSHVLNEHDPFFPVSLCLQQYFLETARLRLEVSKGGSSASRRVSATIGTLRSSIGSAAIAVQHAAASRNRVGSADSSNTHRTLDTATKETVHRLDQHERILKEQQALYDETSNAGFLNASLANTISLCIQLDMLKKADELASHFSVSKKMLAWARVNGAIARGKTQGTFDSAYRLIDQWFGKSCEFGYGPLVQALIDAEQPSFAALFIKKVTPLEERMEFYVKCKKWREAAEDCRKEGAAHFAPVLRSRAQGDPRALQEIAAGGL